MTDSKSSSVYRYRVSSQWSVISSQDAMTDSKSFSVYRYQEQ